MTTRWCPKCETHKPFDDFYKDSRGLAYSYCQPCKVKVNISNLKKQYERIPELYSARKERSKKRWRGLSFESRKAIKLRRYWPGIGHKEAIKKYNAMVETQNGLCAICKRPESIASCTPGKIRSLSVDHCHKTGKVRELLCTKCNQMLGLANESIAVLDCAKEYLRRHESK